MVSVLLGLQHRTFGTVTVNCRDCVYIRVRIMVKTVDIFARFKLGYMICILHAFRCMCVKNRLHSDMIAYSFVCKHSRKLCNSAALSVLVGHPSCMSSSSSNTSYPGPHWSTDPGRGAKGLGRVVGSWAQRCNKVVVTGAVSS